MVKHPAACNCTQCTWKWSTDAKRSVVEANTAVGSRNGATIDQNVVVVAGEVAESVAAEHTGLKQQ